MTNRINLAYINLLEEESTTLFISVVSQSLTVDAAAPKLDDNTIAWLVKAHIQAQNLVKQLHRLYQTCNDLAAGYYEPYVAEWTNEQKPFDPFKVLKACFNDGSICDLPEKIEQYIELLALTRQYSDMQKARQQGILDLFDKQQIVHSDDKALDAHPPGAKEILQGAEPTETEMDEIDRLAAKQTIQDIEIDYCLDGYNRFYETATRLLGKYTAGDVVTCCQAILSLFVPAKQA